MQWVAHLIDKIEQQDAYAKPWETRYRNDFVLPFIAAEYREVYGSSVDALLTQINPPRTGMAGIVVDALTDRLTITGATTSGDPAASKVVWDAWEACDLDVMYREAHREAFIASRAFAQLDVARDGRAIVGIESATQVAVHRQAHPPYDVDAALKITADEWTGKRRGRLVLLDEDGKVVRYDLHEGEAATLDPQGSRVMSRWVASEPQSTSFSRVPFVEFSSRPRLLADPVSEVEQIASLCDISDLVEGLMVFAGHFGAVPIRWGTGLGVPRDPKDPTKPLLDSRGKPMIGFNPRADHMWVSTEKEAKFGQLEPAGLASFVAWAEHVSSRIRARTQIASTYISMDLKSHMSAELLKTDEAPMVRRINSIGPLGSFGQSWRRVNQMILDIERPDLARSTVKGLWEDPQTRIESIDADRFSKLVGSLGAYHCATEILGWSPELAMRAVAEAESARARLASADPMLEVLGKPLTSAGLSG